MSAGPRKERKLYIERLGYGQWDVFAHFDGTEILKAQQVHVQNN